MIDGPKPPLGQRKRGATLGVLREQVNYGGGTSSVSSAFLWTWRSMSLQCRRLRAPGTASLQLLFVSGGVGTILFADRLDAALRDVFFSSGIW